VILQSVNVSKLFGSLAALKNVNFEVKREELFGIVGPNGAGKTTLFNVVTGGLKSSGKVVFEGKNISGFKPHQICLMGIARTFQIPFLFLSMSVFENIWVGAHFGVKQKRIRKEEEKEVRQLIDFVGLKGKEDIIVKRLDLFSIKKVMLAAALATRPSLLLLDEPLGGLSSLEVEQTKRLILQINKEWKVTVILIEHLLEVILEVCDRVMVLNSEVITIKSPKEVMEDKIVKEVYLKV